MMLLGITSSLESLINIDKIHNTDLQAGVLGMVSINISSSCHVDSRVMGGSIHIEGRVNRDTPQGWEGGRDKRGSSGIEAGAEA